jgi:hypothetical protein
MHISRIDSELYNLIKEDKVTEISIKSRFTTSLSGYSGGYFITLLDEGKELLPMSMVLSGKINEMSNLSVLSVLENLVFDSNTVIEDLHIQKENGRDLHNTVLEEVKKFLEEKALKESFYPLLTRTKMLGLPVMEDSSIFGTESFFVDRVITFLTCLENGNVEDAPLIVGFGAGLTPSSDDWLLGVLSVFLYAEDTRLKQLIQYINVHKDKTTEVSHYMLHYAAEHRLFPMIVKRFFQDNSRLNDVLEDFLSHGGTSGIDLLCGIYTGMFLLFKK